MHVTVIRYFMEKNIHVICFIHLFIVTSYSSCRMTVTDDFSCKRHYVNTAYCMRGSKQRNCGKYAFINCHVI